MATAVHSPQLDNDNKSRHVPRPLSLSTAAGKSQRRSDSTSRPSRRSSGFRSSISITSPWKDLDNALPSLKEESTRGLYNMSEVAEAEDTVSEATASPMSPSPSTSTLRQLSLNQSPITPASSASPRSYSFPRRLSLSATSPNASTPNTPSPHHPRSPSRSASSSPRVFHPRSPSLSSPSPLPRSPAISTPSTPADVNASLLVTIAEKERKVLELKEELQRHEDELKGLKKQWEENMAKMAPVVEQPSKEEKASRRRSMMGLSLVDSPPPPKSPAAALGPIAQDAAPAIKTGKKLADSFGRGLMGFMQNLAAPLEEEPEAKLAQSSLLDGKSPRMDTLAEEEEEEDQEEVNDLPSTPAKKDLRATDYSSRRKVDTSSTSSIDSFSSTSSGPKTPVDKVQQQQQHRRRSTMDFAANAGRSAWSNMAASINSLSKSESFQSSKRRTMQFMDTFEKTLTDVMESPLAEGPKRPNPDPWAWDEEDEEQEMQKIPQPVLVARPPVGGKAGATIKGWFESINEEPKKED